ncbi:MAG: hypothetical protein ABJ363_03830 [Alphaproteobacteria bacterium]
MSLTAHNPAHSEAMLGYHDPTLGVGIDARGAFGGAENQGDGEGFFSTLLDIVNPLQHIPLVSSLYREITGDEISPSARIVGGGLFGGPIGLASASANAIFEQASGDDMLGHALAMFSDETGPDIAPLQARAKPAEADIHEQADAGDYAGDATNPEIVLGGPPALASLTPAVATAAPVSLAPPVAPPVARPVPAPLNAQPAVRIDRVTNNAAPDAAPGAPAVATPAPTTAGNAAETDSFLRSLPANWVNEALRDAESMNEALQNGAAPEAGTAKPWVGNAMLDALNKYEALTRARNAPPAG